MALPCKPKTSLPMLSRLHSASALLIKVDLGRRYLDAIGLLGVLAHRGRIGGGMRSQNSRTRHRIASAESKGVPFTDELWQSRDFAGVGRQLQRCRRHVRYLQGTSEAALGGCRLVEVGCRTDHDHLNLKVLTGGVAALYARPRTVVEGCEWAAAGAGLIDRVQMQSIPAYAWK